MWCELSPQTGRSDKIYCSDACRMRAYRKRKSATVSKTEALAKSIVNKAIGGDPRAAQLATTLIKELLPMNDVDGAGVPALSEEDRAVLNNHAAYLKLLERGRNGD